MAEAFFDRPILNSPYESRGAIGSWTPRASRPTGFCATATRPIL
jgi:hypothetical protein